MEILPVRSDVLGRKVIREGLVGRDTALSNPARPVEEISGVLVLPVPVNGSGVVHQVLYVDNDLVSEVGFDERTGRLA